MSKKIKYLAPFLLFFPIFLSAQWQKQVLPLESFEDLYGISFLADNDFFICSNTEISHTTDGGANWQVKNLNEGAPFIPFLTNTLYDLHFYNSSSGIATGAFNLTNNELVIRSDDGNQSWYISYLDASLPPPAYFHDMDVRGQNVLVCGEYGHIIRSTDGGVGFSSVATVSDITLSDILFLDDNRAIALGDTKVLRSNNGGASWVADPIYEGKGACCIVRADANTLYMDSEGVLLRSSDNGLSFAPASANPVPGGPGLLAASHDTLLTYNSLGICVSVNGGKGWKQFKSTKDLPVNRLVIRNGKAYALCGGAALYTLDLNAMNPQPIAYFSTDVQSECGKSTLSAIAAADTAEVELKWFLNGTPVGNQPVFTQVYTDYITQNQNLVLVVTDKLSLQTDTLKLVPGILFIPKAELDLGPDQYLCNEARALIKPSGDYSIAFWVNDGIFDPAFWFSGYDGSVTYPLLQDTQVIAKAWYDEQCITYDTVNIYIEDAYHERYHFSDPKVPNSCSNANCAYIPDIQFVNEQTGYGMTTNGRFLKTSDAGKTWTLKDLNSGLVSAFPRGSVDFVDELTGFTTCPNRKTTDGGQTFTNITAPHDGYGFTDFVDYINADTGVYVVSNAFSPGFSTVYKTTDGGQTFNQILKCSFRLWDIKFFDSNTIFVGGGYSTYAALLKSSDAGLSWDTIPIPNPTYNVWSIEPISKDTFFITDGGFIHRTYDEGQHWYSYFFPNGAGKIKMLNNQIGYASGYGNVFYKTENGGDCWTPVFEAEYPNIDAIAIPPSGNSIYFTANDESSLNNGPVVYHTRFYRDLAAEIKPVSCAGTPVHTQNKSFGYTHYDWYLDGNYYGSGYDVEKVFYTPGDYTFKMVADSAGLFRDSVTVSIHIKEGPGSLGQIEGPRELCGMNEFSQGYELPQNDAFLFYNWSHSDYPHLISSGTGSPNNDRYFNLHSFSGSGEISLQVFAIDTLGCYSDTATALISIVNTLPPDPVSLDLSVSCYDINVVDLVVPDSISFIASPVPGASAYEMTFFGINSGTFAEPSGDILPFTYCSPGTIVYDLYASNVCGWSVNAASDSIIAGFDPFPVIYSHDTIVEPGAVVPLFIKGDFNPLFQDVCPNIPAKWYHEGQYYNEYNGTFLITASSDYAGKWTAKIYNGCDTLSFDVHVGLTTSVQNAENEAGSLLIAPNPNNGEFSLVLPEAAGAGARLVICSAAGQRLREFPITAGASQQFVSVPDLPAGFYWVQWVENDVVKAQGKFVR